MPRRRGNGKKTSSDLLAGEDLMVDEKEPRAKMRRSGGTKSGPGSRQDPPKNRARGRTIGQTFDALMQGNLSVVPHPNIYELADGRKVGTEVFQDRFISSRPAALTINVSSINWEGLAKAHWFQAGGTNNDGTIDAVLGGFMQNLYGAIVRELASHKNRLFAIRDTTLVNTGTFNSLPGWLNNYTGAFLNLRCLQSILASGGFNYTLQLAAAAVNQALPRLLADLDRLYSYGVPPMLITYLDRLCGVKAWDNDSPVYIAGLNGGTGTNPVFDITSPTAINSLLALAESDLTALQTGAGGGTAIAAADAQAISNIFAYAYGEPKFDMVKGVSFDQGEYMMQQTSCVTYEDQTAAKEFSFPNTNVGSPGRMIPFLVPRGLSGDCGYQFFSLLRTPVISVDSLVGIASTSIPNQIGLLNNFGNRDATHFATALGEHIQVGTFTAFETSAAGTTTYSWQQAETELIPWIGEAGLELTNYTTDRRSFRDLDIVWLALDWCMDNTEFLLTKMFLDPLRLQGGSFIPG